MGAAVLPAGPEQAARLQAFNTTPQRSEGGDAWCREAQRNNDNDHERNRETFCEVREFTLGAGAVAAETSNGSVSVTGERRNDVLVRAMVLTRASTAERAREIAREITVSTSGTIRATGPRSYNREGWHVSFRIQAPQSTDLTLTSSNGSLSASDVRGRLRLRTSNGSIRLMDVGGDVEADTSNGSVNATLSGSTWDGAGLSVSTSNGSVRLMVPENYNARLVAGTSNGSINVGFPVTVQGNLRRGRDIDTTLGSGGPTIRVRTSNGSVRLERK
jgi:DUF4097 and DUF4098 domain-containing protein YvlB